MSKDRNDYVLIKHVFEQGHGKWGIRTLEMKLKNNYGAVMNHKKIARIKNKYGLVTKIRRRSPFRMIMKKNHEHRVFPNILNREFQQDKPRTVFCTDITYLPFGKHMAYLSAVKDIASREIVGWSLGETLHMDLVIRTLENLKQNINGSKILIHSDQGFHYTSPDFSLRAKLLGLVQSMSRKGNCTDNGPMESFFGHFKDEVNYKGCKSFEELEQLTHDYMNYYNTERYQWNLNKMTPVEYRQYLLDQGS